jgi:hypothetical protein
MDPLTVLCSVSSGCSWGQDIGSLHVLNWVFLFPAWPISDGLTLPPTPCASVASYSACRGDLTVDDGDKQTIGVVITFGKCHKTHRSVVQALIFQAGKEILYTCANSTLPVSTETLEAFTKTSPSSVYPDMGFIFIPCRFRYMLADFFRLGRNRFFPKWYSIITIIRQYSLCR